MRSKTDEKRNNKVIKKKVDHLAQPGRALELMTSLRIPDNLQNVDVEMISIC